MALAGAVPEIRIFGMERSNSCHLLSKATVAINYQQNNY
jgi:hypothetical protein